MGHADVDSILVNLNRIADSEKVLHELDLMGLRVATKDELIAFGATYPDVQRQLSIIALGEV